MSDHLWKVESHNIPAAHIRGYARGIQNEENMRLRLAIKQYTPKSNPNPKSGDITFVVAVGIDGSKEAFEPLFDDLLERFPRIRSIWAIDPATAGASYLLNRDSIGDEPHWFDYPRDIWQMINHFQDLMPPPIVGLGHSLGSAMMIVLSTWHPRLFSGLVLTEPALGPKKGLVWPRNHKYYPGVLAAKRRDKWPSMQEAKKAYAKSPLYGFYDPRVLEKIYEFELTESADKTVSLSTPKAISTYMWLRTDPPMPGFPSSPEDDIPWEHGGTIPGFKRPEGPQTWECLPYVAPPVLILWGDESELFGVKNHSRRDAIVGSLGTEAGGSGGKAKGKLAEVSIPGAHHSLPLEKPLHAAEAIAGWTGKLRDELERQKAERRQGPEFDLSRVNPGIVDRYSKL